MTLTPLVQRCPELSVPDHPCRGWVLGGGVAEFCYNSDNAAGRYGLILAHNKTSHSSDDSNIES